VHVPCLAVPRRVSYRAVSYRAWRWVWMSHMQDDSC